VRELTSDLLPSRLAGASLRQLRTSSESEDRTDASQPSRDHFVSSPMPFTARTEDEEETIGHQRSESRPLLSPATSSFSNRSQDVPRESPSKLRSAIKHLRPARAGLKRRPTAVRIMEPGENQGQRFGYSHDGPPLHDVNKATNLGERTPLIKSGVKPDIRRTAEDVAKSMQVEVGLGRMVELGLPLIMSVQLRDSEEEW